MTYNKNTPLKEGTVVCMCEEANLRKNGVDVTENLKILGLDRSTVLKAWGQEALDFYLQKQKVDA